MYSPAKWGGCPPHTSLSLNFRSVILVEMPRETFRLPDNFWRSLVAVLAGNAIYFGFERHLPPKARHQPYAIDWGLAVDFWMCLVCYGLIGLFRRNRYGSGGDQ